MKHVFITALKQPLETWVQAFPQLQIYEYANAVTDSLAQASQMFWVHVQADKDSDWIAEIKSLVALYPASKVVVLSNSPEHDEAMQALSLGASGYLHAYMHHYVLNEVYNVVKYGGTWLGPDLLKYLINATVQSEQYNQAYLDEATDLLTKREKEVALEAAKGLSNKEIARSLSISERTVKAHLSAVFESMKVKDRLHLALVLKGQSL